MPSMSVFRFTTDEDGRNKAAQDYIIPAAQVKMYPWPPPAEVVLLRQQIPVVKTDQIVESIMGRVDGQPDEDWEGNLAILTENIAEHNANEENDGSTLSAFLFRRHAYSESVNPHLEVPKGARSMAAGAHYVLVRELLPEQEAADES